MTDDVRALRFPDLGTAGGPLRALLGRKRTVRVGGLHGAALGYVLAAVAAERRATIAVVADVRAMDSLLVDLEAFLPAPALAFPLWPHERPGSPPDPEVLAARVRVLEALGDAAAQTAKAPVLVVAPFAALAQPVPTRAALDAAAISLRHGEQHPVTSLLEHLALSGYARVGAVETPGEFAARGGVVDVWPWGAATPVRLDFFGDEIESIRRLDPGTQRSGEAVAAVRLLALAAERFRDADPDAGGTYLPDHLPGDPAEAGLLALVEPPSLAEAAARLRGQGAGEATRVKRLDRDLQQRPVVELSAFPLGPGGDLDLEVGGIDALRGVALSRPGAPRSAESRTAAIAASFQNLGGRVERIVVHRRAEGEEERLRELFVTSRPGAPVEFRRGSLSRSFRFGPTATAHVAYDDLADLPVKERRTARAAPRTRPIQDFLELETGGLVVHQHHGIGVFKGLVTLEGKEGAGEFLKIEFAEGTSVYVPVSRIDLVQRYVGTGHAPRLSKLGGTEWQARKARVEKAVEELAEELLATQAARHQRHGPPSPRDGEWQHEFEAAFPFPDTPDQAVATRAVKQDLESEKPMDRLLCGDVGYGKTEVALRAVFKAVSAGRQAAVLVPTKVLAEQHVRVFSQRFGPYPLRVRALSSLHAERQNRETIAGLADGSVDVVVGTHRLLSKDVVFHDLRLVVVDEEQRFGVQHKERIKALRSEVDVLTLSATPIPRTLHMALLGIRDISNLTTPPLGRYPVETKVAREDEDLFEETLRRELDRGGQAFVVTSRIKDLPLLASRIVARIPEARVASIHGRLDKDLVEERMLRFVRGEVDVLLATTIIESGLDIPNANTIVIRDADRYGLAELHQLRGRVGRERRHAHCLLLVPPDRHINPEARERLKAIEEYSELGAGFRIAMRDLEIRGAGNLLGPQQSGHIAAVGYDLYCRLLAEAVRRARGEGPPERLPAVLSIDLPGAVPDTYVPDVREKFRLFRRLATTATEQDLDDLLEETRDRFGPLPPEMERLVLAQRVRVVAGRAGVVRVLPAEVPGVILDTGEVAGGIDRLARRLRLRPLSETTGLLPVPAARTAEDALRELVRRLAADAGREAGGGAHTGARTRK